MTSKNKKKKIDHNDGVLKNSLDLGDGVKLDPNNEIESGPEEKLIAASNNDGIVFSGVMKKDETEKPINNILSNINAESQSAADPTYERISFSGKKKARNNNLPVILIFLCLFLAVAATGAFYVFIYKNNIGKKESPQQIINSSVESMRKVKTYASEGSAILNFTVSDSQSSMNLDGNINIDMKGKIDANDINSPKSQYNAKAKFEMKGVGGSEDFSVDFESIAFGQKAVYYKINDFDLGAYGIMMGSQLSSFKNKWYGLDSDELKKMPGYDESRSPIMENYDMNKIMDILGNYEILKFEKDLGNEKTGNIEVYHYRTKLDGMAVLYMYLDILKEIGSKYPEEFELNLSNIRKDAEDNYRDLINEGFQNTEVEIWIGKGDRYVYRMLINGSLDEKYMDKFINSTLGSARAKALDAKIKSDVSGVRPSLEMYYDGNNGSYENFALPEYFGLKPENVKTGKDSYVVWSELSSTTDKWCVDSNGESGYVLEEIEGFSCPDSISDAPRGEKKDFSESDIAKSNDNAKMNVNFKVDLLNIDFNKPVEIEKPEDAINLFQEMSSILGPLISGIGDSSKYSHDSDGDGLTDDMEKLYGTDVNNPDTDGDGYADGQEVDNDYDPLVPGNAKLDYEKLFSN
ncbi:MAG: hypothetical protein WA063_03215 [Minisyncoccia bacterium]